MNLPPAQDLKALISEEHHKAELLRLRMGEDGCGCAEYQAFYQTINLSVYGERVKRYFGTISIVAGSTGADIMDTNRDHWDDTGQIFFTEGKGYGITPELENICVGREVVVLAYFSGGAMPGGITPGAEAELIRVKELKAKGDLENARAGENFKPKRPGTFRNRAVGEIKRRAGYTRQASKGKRLPLCKVKRQVPVLSSF